MTASSVDADALLRCADEPIAVPGAVQPQGALLAVTEPGLAVVVASANAPEFFRRPVAGSSSQTIFRPGAERAVTKDSSR